MGGHFSTKYGTRIYKKKWPEWEESSFRQTQGPPQLCLAVLFTTFGRHVWSLWPHSPSPLFQYVQIKTLICNNIVTFGKSCRTCWLQSKCEDADLLPFLTAQASSAAFTRGQKTSDCRAEQGAGVSRWWSDSSCSLAPGEVCHEEHRAWNWTFLVEIRTSDLWNNNYDDLVL